MADSEDWSTNANEAIQITLNHREKSRDVHFHPGFTYPIFGEEESIFGYKDLKIKFDYAADTLKSNVTITWDEKYDPVGDTEADNIREILADFLPQPLKIDVENSTSGKEAFKPPGELVHQYEANGRKFGIWKSPLAAKEASHLVENMQIFVTFFIDGGTFLELNDSDWTVDRWTVFFLYAIDEDQDSSQPSYSFAGYATAYRLYFFDSSYFAALTQPSTSPLDADTDLTSHLPCRQRISQFLVLPPYHNAGHGSHLYSTMISSFLTTPSIREITVEDPNEAFDDLRDHNDLLRLRSTDTSFALLAINAAAALPPARSTPLPTSSLVDPTTISAIRARSKLAPRQFDRLVEMQLLSAIPPANRSTSRITRKDKSKNEHDRAYYFWRLLAKQRLYKHNAEVLGQLELEERVDKLEETLAGVERDYERILEGAERRATRGGVAVAVNNGEASDVAHSHAKRELVLGQSRGSKRKVVDEDDDEDEQRRETDAKGKGKAVISSAERSTPRSTSSKKTARKKVTVNDEDE